MTAPETLRNRELVVYAAYVLGGAVQRLHTEDIAIKAHELFPASFSWTKHPNLPDKDIVRVALTDARKPKYGELIEGRTGQHRGQSSKTRRAPALDGWGLTPAGLSWALSNEQRLSALTGTDGQLRDHRQKILKQLGRIRRHELFLAYIANPDEFEPNVGRMAELLRCRVDADDEVWLERFDGIRRKATATEQEDVLEFIDTCELAYRAQLS